MKDNTTGQYTDVSSEGYVTPADGTIDNGDKVVSGTLPKLNANSQYEITYDVVLSDIADNIGSLQINNRNSVDIKDKSRTSGYRQHHMVQFRKINCIYKQIR